MRLSAALFAALLLAPLPALAQDIIPDRFVTITQDADFPGNDLRPVFDTTLSACEATCRADPECVGFTYNGRNGSCFPKSEVTEPVAYANALSGELLRTSPAVLARLDERLAALSFLREGDLTGARDQALGMGRHRDQHQKQRNQVPHPGEDSALKESCKIFHLPSHPLPRICPCPPWRVQANNEPYGSV